MVCYIFIFVGFFFVEAFFPLLENFLEQNSSNQNSACPLSHFVNHYYILTLALLILSVHWSRSSHLPREDGKPWASEVP